MKDTNSKEYAEWEKSADYEARKARIELALYGDKSSKGIALAVCLLIVSGLIVTAVMI